MTAIEKREKVSSVNADNCEPHSDNMTEEAYDFLSSLNIWPVFQPIIDLYSATPLGYEVLTRGAKPYATPMQIFRSAEYHGVLWDTEFLCRRVALEKISLFVQEIRGGKFFLNVSPGVLSDPRFVEGCTLARLQEHGLRQENLVIEITECASIFNYPNFENLIAHYKNQGFRIAIDDFGSGHASLSTIIATDPHFLKLDKLLVRDIHQSPHKQQMVTSMLSFAENTNTKLIAEGVECEKDLETLVRLGVRFAQGYFFARPEREPAVLSLEQRLALSDLVSRFNRPRAELRETISGIISRPKTVEKGAMNCEELDHYFRANPDSDHVVITKAGGEPYGLVTRKHFTASTSGAFGYSLTQRKDVDTVAQLNPLVVKDGTHVVELARMAMQRMQEETYDPVLVVGPDGTLVGSVTMKQLILRASRLEVDLAMDANPLTNLPGNRSIQKWIARSLDLDTYSVVYIDLDNFKCYNDVYGFMKGDDMIRLTAKVLQEGLSCISPEATIGHIGGDDFVIVSPGVIEESGLQHICQQFDQEKLDLFKYEHIKDGGYESCDRKGNCSKVQLVSMSVSVVESCVFESQPHPAQLAKVAASLKKLTKKDSARKGHSCYRYERRRYTLEQIDNEHSDHDHEALESVGQ